MKWEDIRKKYPDQWVLIKDLKSHIVRRNYKDYEVVDEFKFIKLIETEADYEEAFKFNKGIPFSTKQETLEIEVRHLESLRFSKSEGSSVTCEDEPDEHISNFKKITELTKTQMHEYIRNTVKYAIENNYIHNYYEVNILMNSIADTILSVGMTDWEVWGIAFDLLDDKLKEFGVELSHDKNIRRLQLDSITMDLYKFILGKRSKALAAKYQDIADKYNINDIEWIFELLLKKNITKVQAECDVPMEILKELRNLIDRGIDVDYSDFKPTLF